ncbi:Maf family protein [Hespellia stercorisuis]|uniref:dTTP/UTP pyrophosphatase n=1 Tax=Hespellia stercorisuis DSM 15480 TaxID=1121950 RepID=A0A1M6LE50_9FIRM|nr:Maf family protein [Hespellia stercorisuis]SHJ69490.1 septum formation protein [Hespellia stercorisuis DSM 15480]
MELILASASPRRKELLEQLGLTFEIIPAQGEEIIRSTKPDRVVQDLALQKAQEVAAGILNRYYIGEKELNRETMILGADTVVATADTILGKPADEREAEGMLMTLQGRTHQVYTGVCAITIFQKDRKPQDARIINFSEKTDVTLFPMTQKEIRDYIRTGDPLDKAGAYGIQGIFAKHIEKIDGDYNNVVGLPIGRLWQMCLRKEEGSKYQM